MMKKIIITLSIVCMMQMMTYGQETNPNSIWKNSKIELLGCYGLFEGGTGVVLKAKKEILNSKHFESYAGLGLQYNYWSEKDKLLEGFKGYNRDIGSYLLLDLIYYPLKGKNIFTGPEVFIGLTNLKSKGSLKIPVYYIENFYTNSYTYINYGFSWTIGYSFGSINTGIFGMMSLKGILDRGRTRPGDFDSKIFLGVSVSYNLH